MPSPMTVTYAGTNGTVTFTDTTAAAIELAMGATGVQAIGSTASSLNAIATALVGVNKQQNGGTKTLTSIQSAVADLDATLQVTNGILSQMLATQWMTLANQIEKAEFEKAATNAALKRNKLPEVSVDTPSFQAQVTKTMSNTANIAAQASASGAVITAITSTSTYLSNVTGVSAALKTGQTWVKQKIEGVFKSQAANPDVGKSAADLATTQGQCSAKGVPG